ncbi:hypothetical protein SBRY_100235 [Actinacidiphila bryophytorum]|uniref:Transposase n=1 Tax=Actinacidiphila bryophytorum TaxID=1436133 RepID=A0A9W4ECR7_9ACTN|nr:hypothetical protein SBRY_100235 [Actinacidiphila bryophytorum]
MSQFYALASAGSSPATPSCDCLAHRFGNAADNGTRERRYPTDMTDAQWAAIRPLLPVPGWLQGRGGQPEAYCHRAILDQCHEVKRSAAASRVREMWEEPLLSRGSTKIFLREQRPSGPVCHGRNR